MGLYIVLCLCMFTLYKCCVICCEVSKTKLYLKEIEAPSLDEKLTMSPGKPIHNSSVLADVEFRFAWFKISQPIQSLICFFSFHDESNTGEDLSERKEKSPQTENEKIMSLFNINRDDSRFVFILYLTRLSSNNNNIGFVSLVASCVAMWLTGRTLASDTWRVSILAGLKSCQVFVVLFWLLKMVVVICDSII